MNITLVIESKLPVFAYGGTERVVWDLAKGLCELGHEVTLLAGMGTQCDFAKVIELNEQKPVDRQAPPNTDIVHFHSLPKHPCEMPHVFTQHAHADLGQSLPLNTVFVSSNHAKRHGSLEYVWNGLDWSTYGPALTGKRLNNRFHFLGKASWSVKNVKGAIEVAKLAGVELDVLGGNRLNIKRGFRYTWSRQMHFHGMVGGSTKIELLRRSNGLIFPVRWNEPFGLAVIESMYFGCPVFATPYGALPEIVTNDCGVLSNSKAVLSESVKSKSFDPAVIHQRAATEFTHIKMAQAYLVKYQRVLDGCKLNPATPMLFEHPKKMAWID